MVYIKKVKKKFHTKKNKWNISNKKKKKKKKLKKKKTT